MFGRHPRIHPLCRGRPNTLPRGLRPNWWGIAGAQVSSWIALGPSLLPRTWWMTAGSLGLSQLYGYGIGTAARALRRMLLPRLRRRLPEQVRQVPEAAQRAWRFAVVSTLVGGTVLAFFRSVPQQREIAELVDRTPPSARTQLAGSIAGTGLTAVALGVIALFRLQSRGTSALLQRFLPAFAAPFSGAAVTFATTYFLNRSVLWKRLMAFLHQKALDRNTQPLPGRIPPQQPERSGSGASFEPFTTLGRHGKAVVSDGPRAADIAEFWREHGDPNATAHEPVRAYVGLRAQVSIPDAAKRAVRELKRAGGFEREHLCIMVGTGTGWLSDWSMNAFEYLTRGNCAVVSMQYTVLTSALALLADRNSSQLSARSLYREVRAELERMPESRRPKLYVSAESLGAFGALSVFPDAANLPLSLDGAVLAGTPQFSPIWQELTRNREPGSRQILPRIADGREIRFSNHSADLACPPGAMPYAPWGQRRFLLLQHPSDPVVWWHPRLIWRQPEWMREARGFDVTERMRWWPWVTFWQITADMAASIASAGGHAHRYYEEYVPAWMNVLGVHAPVEALQQAVARHVRPH